MIAGTAKVRRMRPCPAAYAIEAAADTRTAPFTNGANALQVCAFDYGAGAVPGCTSRTIHVDNAPPELAFANRESDEDPELIRATAVDSHSGLAAWSIAYRPQAGKLA